MENKPLLTYQEAADLLGIKLATLYALVSKRAIPHIRVSGRIVRFDAAELRAWLEARSVPVTQAGGGA